MHVAHQNEIDLEGACEGVCACSTCHGIFPRNVFDQLPEASEDEEDMLDMAPGLTETSRLCCQVVAEKYMDGMTITMPRTTSKQYFVGIFDTVERKTSFFKWPLICFILFFREFLR